MNMCPESPASACNVARHEGYERVSDQQVEDAYGKQIHKQICGLSGTVFFGDTLAFHKGTPPKLSIGLCLSCSTQITNLVIVLPRFPKQ